MRRDAGRVGRGRDPPDFDVAPPPTSAIHDYLYPQAVRRFLAASESSAPEAEQAALRQAVWQAFDVLDQAVGRMGFLVGDRLFLADLSLGPLVSWVDEAIGLELLTGLAGIERSRRALQERPSWRVTQAS